MSFFELSLFYAGPVLAVFFFFSKFFYLHFFEKKGTWQDSLKSFRHGLIFSLSFVLVLIMLYCVVSVKVYDSSMSALSKGYDSQLYEAETIKTVLEKQPVEVKQLRVSRELSAYAADQRININVDKSFVDGAGISLGAILDDSYLSDISYSTERIMSLSIAQRSIPEAKDEILDAYSFLSAATNGTHFIETNISLLEYADGLEAEFEDSGYPDSSYAADFILGLRDRSLTPDDFEEQGLFWMALSPDGLTVLLPWDIYYPSDLVESELFYVLKHSVLLRELSVLSLDIKVTAASMGDMADFKSVLIADRHSDESAMSRAVRYSFLLGKRYYVEETGYSVEEGGSDSVGARVD
jgi:hypothetical protein